MAQRDHKEEKKKTPHPTDGVNVQLAFGSTSPVCSQECEMMETALVWIWVMNKWWAERSPVGVLLLFFFNP